MLLTSENKIDVKTTLTVHVLSLCRRSSGTEANIHIKHYLDQTKASPRTSEGLTPMKQQYGKKQR